MVSRGIETIDVLAGKYGEASVAGYTQSPGGFGSPAASQGADKKGVSNLSVCIILYNSKPKQSKNTHVP